MRSAGTDRLVERERELADVQAAINEARDGSGSLVVVDGEGGIGKSRLCEAARELAADAGMRVLRARGGELEHDLTYGIVRQLFERHLHDLGATARRSVLSGPARLAGVALDPETREPRLSVETGIDHGLYWLTSNLAERQPPALIVDDAHWADAASLRFLLYLARRLDGLPAVVVVAARGAEPEGEKRLLGLLGAEPVCRRLTLRPLSRQGVAELLSARLERDVSEPLADRCHEVSGGNPFLIGEIVRSLSGDDARDAEQTATLAPRAVTRSILLRLGRQGPDARAVAEALAAAGDGVSFGVLREIVGLESAAVGTALDALTREGIASPGPCVAFAHPIVRTAIYGDIPHWRRQQLHGRAATALAGRGSPAVEIAHHLLLSEPEGSEATVECLREGARLATERGSHENAVRMLARALAEPPAEATRVSVLMELGEAELRAGAPADASGHLEEAIAADLSDGDLVRASLALAQAIAAMGGHAAAVERLSSAIGAVDGEHALRLDVERTSLSLYVMDLAAAAQARMREYTSLPGETATERLALATAALAIAFDPASSCADALPVAESALAGDKLLREHTADAPPWGNACYVVYFAERLDEFDRQATLALADARDRGSLYGFMTASLGKAMAALPGGALSAAIAHGEDALGTWPDLAHTEVAKRWISTVVRIVADALVHKGELDAARTLVTDWLASEDANAIECGMLRVAEGLVASADGDHERAYEAFSAYGQLCEVAGYEDRTTPWRIGAALAAAATGRGENALHLVQREVEIVRTWGTPGGVGVALHAQALVADRREAAERLSEAVELLQASPYRLALAEALIDLGATLRRDGRRSDARDRLEAGLDLAARCEAHPLIDRARSELAVLGARPRRLMFSGIEGLTAAERRVAAMAAEGMSNREIAEILFVTVKTVETHLRSAYRKLDITSRGDLPGKLGAEPKPESRLEQQAGASTR